MKPHVHSPLLPERAGLGSPADAIRFAGGARAAGARMRRQAGTRGKPAAAVTVQRIFVPVFVCLLPFLQIGLSYYQSVVFLMFLGLAFWSAVAAGTRGRLPFRAIGIGGIAFGVKLIYVCLQTAANPVLLRIIREYLCYAVMLILACAIAATYVRTKLLGGLITVFLCVIVALLLIQSRAIDGGAYFGIPRELFVANEDTLTGVDLALETGTRLRPTSFYGEPSYTAFITNSLLAAYLVACHWKGSRTAGVCFLAFAACLLSESMAGILAAMLIISAWIVGKNRSGHSGTALPGLVGAGMVVFAVILLAATFSEEFQDRVSEIWSGHDDSANTRLIEPLKMAGKMIGELRFFGLDESFVRLDNALFGLFINYGLFGIFPLWCLLAAPRVFVCAVYVIVAMNFNGAVFSFDKSIVMGAVIGLGFHAQAVRPSGRLRERRDVPGAAVS